MKKVAKSFVYKEMLGDDLSGLSIEAEADSMIENCIGIITKSLPK